MWYTSNSKYKTGNSCFSWQEHNKHFDSTLHAKVDRCHDLNSEMRQRRNFWIEKYCAQAFPFNENVVSLEVIQIEKDNALVLVDVAEMWLEQTIIWVKAAVGNVAQILIVEFSFGIVKTSQFLIVKQTL